MPFREKTAWITLIALLAPTAFFAAIGLGVIHGHGMSALHWFLHSVVAFVLLRVVLHLIAARMAPKDAKAPFDERERLIGLRAGRNAHIALILGVLCIPLALHASAFMEINMGDIGYIAMVALVFSEIVRAISTIIYYRLDR